MYFILKHPLIKGEFNSADYKDCVRVYGIHYGHFRYIEQITGSSRRHIGPIQYEEFSCYRKMDSSTPVIMNECFAGKPYDCEIIFLDGNSRAILSLNEAIVCVYHMEVETHTGQVIEFMKINYTGADFRQIN